MILDDEIIRKNSSCVNLSMFGPLVMLERDFDSFLLINLELV